MSEIWYSVLVHAFKGSVVLLFKKKKKETELMPQYCLFSNGYILL